MAQSNSFFGLRRGSTKSHTYQVYKGKQITKDRVTDVANPQSEAQMKQRMKVPLVAASRSILKELINHSFEGVSYGDDSIKAFQQANLRTNELSVSEYVPKGVADTGVCNLLVSRGTLKEQILGDINAAQNGFTYYGMGDGQNVNAFKFDITADVAADAEVPAWLATQIFAFLGIDSTSQLTFLVEYEGNTFTFPTSSTTEETGHYHRWVISRLIGDANRLGAWRVKNALKKDSEDGQEIILTDGYLDLVIPESTDAAEEGYDMSVRLTATSRVVCAATVIYSSEINKIWRRSTQRMKYLKKATNMTYENCVFGYLNSTTAATSAKYLNTGTEGVGIDGGTV